MWWQAVNAWHVHEEGRAMQVRGGVRCKTTPVWCPGILNKSEKWVDGIRVGEGYVSFF